MPPARLKWWPLFAAIALAWVPVGVPAWGQPASERSASPATMASAVAAPEATSSSAATPTPPATASVATAPATAVPAPTTATGPIPSVSSSAPGVPSSAAGAVDVRLHEKPVFQVRGSRAGQSAAERAKAASRALDVGLDDTEQQTTRLEESPGTAVIFIGKTPIIALADADAAAAGGDVSLHVFASSTASKIDDALRAERRRTAIATSVLSFSLLVSSALLAFLLFRRVGDLSVRARSWVREHPDAIPALKLGQIEVVRPIAVRGAVSIALALAHRLAQFTIAYSWLIFALSRFEATRDYTGRLAGFVLGPLSALIGRLGAALPLFVVAAFAALALGIAVRFVGLFFVGVARGETHLAWLPNELAQPTSVLIRAGMVVVSIALAAPLITGTDDGALSRAGIAALVAIGLACTPVLACAAAGLPMVYLRRIRPGDHVEAGGRAGVVRDVTLLELILEDTVGCEVRIPQLLSLWHPTRVLGSAPLATLEIAVDPHERPAKVEEMLVAAAVATCERARVELVSFDADGARWKVSGIPKHGKGAASLADAVVQAIQEQGIALGRGSSRSGTRL